MFRQVLMSGGMGQTDVLANRDDLQGERITPANMIISCRLDLDKCTSEEYPPDTSRFMEEIAHGSFQNRLATGVLLRGA
jgi:hypothetical protein